MILMDTRVRTRTSGSGTFRCPRESGSRRYRLNSVRRWLFLGPIPVVRLREAGRFVECQSCASTFEPTVLAMNGEVGPEDVLTRALRCAVGVLLGVERAVSSDDRREAVITVQRYASVPYNQQNLERDLQRSSELLAELRALSNSLNDHGRAAVLDASAELAGRGGSTKARLGALRAVAEAVAITPEAVSEAIGAAGTEALLAG